MIYMRILLDNKTVACDRAVFGTENGGDGGKEIGADQLVCLRLLTGGRGRSSDTDQPLLHRAARGASRARTHSPPLLGDRSPDVLAAVAAPVFSGGR